MGILKHLVSPAMLVWYSMCGVLGLLIGTYFGSPAAGVLIGLTIPLVVLVVLGLTFWLFVRALGKMLSPH